MPESLFAKQNAELFTTYDVELTLRGQIKAGIPSNPKLIEGWLLSQAGITDEMERRAVLIRTLTQIGVEVPAEATWEDLEKAAKEVAAQSQTCVFKRNGHGLFIEARQVKAMLKESTNILFAKEKWGKTKKGPRGFVAERVFAQPDEILLGRNVPDGVAMHIGHLNGPDGPRSTLTYYEHCDKPVLTFHVRALNDCVTPEQWAAIWTHAELNGLGALRSQGFGQFWVTRWERSD